MSKRFISRFIATILTLAMVVSSNSFSVFATGFDGSYDDSELVESESENVSFDGENENNSDDETAQTIDVEEEKSEDLSDERIGEDISENASEEGTSENEDVISTDADMSEDNIEESIANLEETIDKKDPASSNIASGKNQDVEWVIDGNGKLVISGSGDWYTYDTSNTWLSRKNEIKSAKIEDYTCGSSLAGMFKECANLKNIDFENVNFSAVKNMNGMFEGCESLDNVSFSFSKDDVLIVENMSGMFEGCESLTSVSFECFDSSNLNNMSSMFSGCTSLKSFSFSGLNTSGVENMSSMFSGCTALSEIDLDDINTIFVKDMSDMFLDCSALSSIDLSKYMTSSVTDMKEMFKGCSNLETLTFGNNFDTSNVKDMQYMFTDCKKLTGLDLSKFSTENVTDMTAMFSGCENLKELKLSSFKTDAVEKMTGMFNDCSNLESLTFGNKFNTSNVKDMQYMFTDCKKLTGLDLSKFSTGKVTDMTAMFSGCESIDDLNLNSFTTNSVDSMAQMFKGCTALSSLTLGELSFAKDASEMFYDCKNLQSLDLSKVSTARATNMNSMFYNCTGLQSLDLSSFATSNVGYMNCIFKNCSNLTELNLSSFEIRMSVSTNEFFSGCTSLEKIITPKSCFRTINLPKYDDAWVDSENNEYNSFPNNSKELTVKKEYTIQYVLGEGTNNSSNPKSYKKNDKVTLKDPKLLAGYTFDGWYDNPDFEGEKITVVEGKDYILYAKWIEHEYTITLIGNGGTFASEKEGGKPTSSRKIAAKYSQSFEPADWGEGLSRTGYKLIGWKRADGKVLIIGSHHNLRRMTAKNKGNVKLTAQWEPIKYTVKFDINASEFKTGDLDGEMADLEVTYGKSVKLIANKYTRKGYTFKGWATEPDATKAKYKNKASIKNLSTLDGEKKTLYAVWSLNTYSVKYNLNGSKGTVPKPAKGLQYGIEGKRLVVENIPENASFAKEGSLYTFKGWSTKAGGEVEFEPGKTTDAVASKDKATITLYAVWEYSYTINDSMSGKNSDNEKTRKAYYNEKIVITDFGMDHLWGDNYRNPGYYIAGWNIDSKKAEKGAIKYKLNAKVKNIAGKTLYAVWKPIKYTVKFDKNAPAGAKVTGKMSNMTATYGKAFTLKANAYKCSGYEFAGWTTEPQGKNADYDNKQKITENLTKENKAVITLYAVWKKKN